MARIPYQNDPPPTTVERWLGINEDTSGDTQLQLGESPNMFNYRLTENYKLRKREGYEELFSAIGKSIRGMWYGKIGGFFHFLFSADGNIYKLDLSDGTYTSIGTLTDAPTTFFAFGNKVYMLNGHEYKSWDGTTFQEVTGYRPVIATATPPTGGGSENEQLNLLTGKKEQWFSPDGVAKDFMLAETNIDAVDFVINRVTGSPYTVTTDYTVDLVAGKVTFVNAPAGGTPDSISIGWTKGNGNRSEVTGHKFAMFYGGQNDTRVFLYGNGSNRYIYSGLAAGVPSAEYFPAFNYNEVGSDEFPVTDIVRQYDRQIIYTADGGTFYSFYETIEDVNGNVIANFPTFPLNSAIGNVAPGQAQLIENNPFTIQNGVHEWIATNVRDERNAVYKSKRVQPSLDQEDLSKAITVDWEAKKEYWLTIGNKVWVYNYRLDAWYKFLLADEITSLMVVENDLYFGTSDGQIMKFHHSLRSDNGQPITRRWEMMFYDFEAEWIRKFMTEMWISLKPEDKTTVSFTFQTDRDASLETFKANYSFATFEHMDFENFSFLVNYNPQPFRFKVKAKKFVYFKLIFEDTDIDRTATVLSMNFPVRYGSKVK